MLKEFVDRIIDLADIEIHALDGREYASRKLEAVQAPLRTPLMLHTLAGLAGAIKAGFCGVDLEGKVHPLSDCAIHVISHESVQVISIDADEWERQTVFVRANVGDTKGRFVYGKKYDVESFIIELQTSFVADETREALLKLVSSMTSDKSVVAHDTGISQEITVKAGVHTMSKVEIPNPVVLRPYRTFIDVEQPASRVVFRVYGGVGEMPQCSLFEADGGAWKLDAMQNIAMFLRKQVEGIQVIA